MDNHWSPHPRFRLYTSLSSYVATLRYLFYALRNSTEAAEKLEAEIRQRFDVTAAVCVPMARTGLFLGLRELIRPGRTVVMSPLTIQDIVNAVILAGGIPLFADICRESCAIDPEQVESLIDHRTGAVLITHLHGETAGAHIFREICSRRGVPLIEDAAQAFGAAEGSERLGTIGDLGIFSFGVYKNVNAWRGGMLVSQDPALISKIRRAVNQLPLLPKRRLLALGLGGLFTDLATWPPLFANFIHPIIRYSFMHGIQAINHRLDPEHHAIRLKTLPADYLFRMTAAQSELIIRQLNHVDADSRARIGHASAYRRALSSLESLIVPKWHDGLSHIYTYYPIQCDRRENLLRYAMKSKRDFAPQYLRNCASLPQFREFNRDCPNAQAVAGELVLLPTYPRYPDAEIRKNIETIQEFFASGSVSR
jgi:perosamine synthetase